ncbi:MAG TPA: SIS domain-containing protein [Kofleriaceae bacterium]|nr:SIS domain-containing protein [Kofleriaceae bacterium]
MTLASEAADAPAAAARQLATLGPALDDLARRLRARPPGFVVTCARGSSDHAATYGKYLLETTVGCAVASMGPSIVSTYATTPRLAGSLFIAVSQSGKSPDLVQLTTAARAAGALVVGMLNDTHSPLAKACDVVLPLCAGEERAVAATKSYLTSCLAFLQLAAHWTDAQALHDAVQQAPEALARALATDLSLTHLAPATSAYVVGRGVGLSAALELALKLKETCRLHAEAFSAAELRHGPIALVGPGFPILALSQDDRTLASMREAIAHLERLGASVTVLPEVDAPGVLAPLCHVQTCYRALPALARARGVDADAPVHLEKVTRTV